MRPRRCLSAWWAPPPSKRLAVVTPQRRVRFPSTSAIDTLRTCRMGMRRSTTDHRVVHPPSVDRLAAELAGSGLPHPLRVDAARVAVAAAVASGDPGAARALADEAVTAAGQGLLQAVINATGVILHTNLGRAPIPVSHAGGLQQSGTRPANRQPGQPVCPRRPLAGPGSRRRGRPGRQQRSGRRPARTDRPGGQQGRDRQPGGAGGDRWRVPHPGGAGRLGSPAGGSRDDQPDPPG